MNDTTPRGLKLPHKDNIASQDVMRIRESLENIDEDLSEQEENHEKLEQRFARHRLEQFLSSKLFTLE